MKLSERMHNALFDHWADEVAEMETKIKRQAEQLTRANAALSPRKQEAMRWKRLHHELGKKYDAVKND